MGKLNAQGYKIYIQVSHANSNGPVAKATSKHDINAITYLLLGADNKAVAKS